mmetsp:Transcript_11453/g.15442  ORF Transcript_11453/g.15442 Transcript_11453/m.15442 type:complete len:234 (-) Transcript_11453:287-988(-)|eukprot:CAMPEP_0185567216 /NCGR_PEP_ID=MMETSP0434-20130131/562_1 /TAXON_ID=626734 ORGANISM="Favella taraikaensis, Strain Fe Narragansett Bay" /NCGR_SAMPLE_ID=MMETSP0434 /ASSEMBLY_ACC=CAM_ASM_000379 /LENGTH=233 /DNA_ID=CAMNT_0028181401 /DNA_START=233 /DNA_END=934 /DNA_ORIENTATION=+
MLLERQLKVFLLDAKSQEKTVHEKGVLDVVLLFDIVVGDLLENSGSLHLHLRLEIENSEGFVPGDLTRHDLGQVARVRIPCLFLPQVDAHLHDLHRDFLVVQLVEADFVASAVLFELDAEVLAHCHGHFSVHKLFLLENGAHEGSVARLVALSKALAPMIHKGAHTGPERSIRILHDQLVQAAPVINCDEVIRLPHLNLSQEVHVFLQRVPQLAVVSIKIDLCNHLLSLLSTV